MWGSGKVVFVFEGHHTETIEHGAVAFFWKKEEKKWKKGVDFVLTKQNEIEEK